MRWKNPNRKITRVPMAVGACVSTALIASSPGAFAQVDSGSTARMERGGKENAGRERRRGTLGGMAQREGLPPGAPHPFGVKAVSEGEQNGLLRSPCSAIPANAKAGVSDAYLWNSGDKSLALNKFK